MKKIIITLSTILVAFMSSGQTSETLLDFQFIPKQNLRVITKYDTTVLNKQDKSCLHSIVAQVLPTVTISCLVYHGDAGCPNDWMNRNFICTKCLYHFNVKESKTTEVIPDEYEEAVKRLNKKRNNDKDR